MSELKYVKNISTDGEATILLYEPIGNYVNEAGELCTGINGSEFAKEIDYLQNNATKINVRINSVGGSVIEGYSIVSAILNSKVPVDIYIDGLAASIAGVIAMCGRRKYIMDYGTLMLHNPSGSNNQALLDLVKNTLVTILQNNSNFTALQVSDVMDKETYYTAKQALNLGLVDEIIHSNKKIRVENNSLQELAIIYNKLINQPKMNLIKNTLGLDEATTEQAIVDSITTLQAEIKTLAETLEAEKLAKQDLQDKLTAIEAEKEAERTATIEAMVNSFVSAGKIQEDEKEKYVRLAGVDFDTVKNTLEKIGSKTAIKIFDVAKVTLTNTANGRDAWTIRDYEKKDPSALAKIKNETPELYAQMYSEYYKTK